MFTQVYQFPRKEMEFNGSHIEPINAHRNASHPKGIDRRSLESVYSFRNVALFLQSDWRPPGSGTTSSEFIQILKVLAEGRRSSLNSSRHVKHLSRHASKLIRTP